MLVKDSVVLEKHDRLTAAEQARSEVHDWLKNQLETSVYVSDDKTSPANFERQLGLPLSTREVERRLRLLNTKLLFEAHPNPTKKAMYFLQADGTKQYIMPYENGLIPERSVLQVVEKETLDPAVVLGKMHIDRGSLTKHEIRPPEFNEDGTVRHPGDVIWDNTEPILGMRRDNIPWCEKVRGYRTMLVILVHAGLITVTQAETAFGSDNRPEWQHKMGKKEHKLPW